MRVLAVIWFLALGMRVDAQEKGWKLHAEKDGVQIFTQPVSNSAFKAVKAVGIVESNLSRIAFVLMDVNTTKEWVYGTKVCSLLKQMTPADLIYYSEVDLPWPASNRDFIIRITLTQDPVSKVMTIVAENMPKYVAEKNGIDTTSFEEAHKDRKAELEDNKKLEESTVVSIEKIKDIIEKSPK